MTLVDDVLGWIDTNYPGGKPADLERVNRDDSELLDGGIRSRTGDLQESNFVGVSDRSGNPSPVGTEYDLKRDADILSVRVEGLHEDEWGHIASDDEFQTLVQNIKLAIYAERHFPATSNAAEYTDLRIENERNRSSDYSDYFLATFDIRFRGYEELP